MKTPPTKARGNELTKGLECPKCGCRHLLVLYT